MLRVDELLKVRNASVHINAAGYHTAIVKKINKASARVALVGSDNKVSSETFLVQFDNLWKLKTATRKALERKVRKAALPEPDKDEALFDEMLERPVVLPLLLRVDVEDETVSGLKTIAKMTLGRSATVVYIACDSVVNFTGDAIVNAANEGCLGGGGIDGEINYRGGDVLHEAREKLPKIDGSRRCNTGDAVVTVAGNLPCSFVVHAVGPRFGHCDDDHADNLDLLKGAYKNAICRAEEKSLKTMGFCILSGGIFRGSCPLKTVIETGLDTILEHASSLERVFFCAFTGAEQAVVSELVAEKAKGIDSDAE